MFIELDQIGERLRAERSRRGLSQRKLAGLVGVSPSLISQMEAGKVQPSVATLMSVVTELGLSIDELFRASEDPDVAKPDAASAEQPTVESSPGPSSNGELPARPPVFEPGGRAAIQLSSSGAQRFVQRSADRARIELNSGVVWERLTPDPDYLADFLHVTYDVGACSSDTNHFLRHEGREYLYVLSGRLDVQIAFESFTVDAGDSIAFDSMRPHRLMNNGDVPAVAVVAVVHP